MLSETRLKGNVTMDKYQETFDTWNNITSLYQDKFMDLDLYNETYDFICSFFDESNTKILEIGCGPGNITKYILSRRPDFDIFGFDVAPNMVELAKLNNPTASFAVLDCRQIKQLGSTFDGIIGGFCLPYLSQDECTDLLHDANEMLHDNGLFYLSFVEGDPEKSYFKAGCGGRVYFNYHRLEHIRAQLVALNFEELKLFKIKFNLLEKGFELHTVLIAKKKSTLNLLISLKSDNVKMVRRCQRKR